MLYKNRVEKIIEIRRIYGVNLTSRGHMLRYFLLLLVATYPLQALVSADIFEDKKSDLKADYVLIIDADEVLEIDPKFVLPDLNKDFYYITTKYGGTRYVRVQLVNNHLNWRWGGVVHEAIDCPLAKTADTLQGVANVVFT